jgi:hypothetical protein
MTKEELLNMIEVSDVKIIDMYEIDLSLHHRYSCKIGGYTFMDETNLMWMPHMTEEQWIEKAKKEYINALLNNKL